MTNLKLVRLCFLLVAILMKKGFVKLAQPPWKSYIFIIHGYFAFYLLCNIILYGITVLYTKHNIQGAPTNSALLLFLERCYQKESTER